MANLNRVVSRKADYSFLFTKTLSKSKWSVCIIVASDPLVQRSPQIHYKWISELSLVTASDAAWLNAEEMYYWEDES